MFILNLKNNTENKNELKLSLGILYSKSWLNWNKDSLNSVDVRCLAEIKLAVCCYYRYNFGQGCLELGEFQTAEIESFFLRIQARILNLDTLFFIRGGEVTPATSLEVVYKFKVGLSEWSEEEILESLK